MSEYEFRLLGKFKPYVRMTRRGKFAAPQALEYLASQNALAWQFKEQMRGEPMLQQVPLYVRITIGMSCGVHKCDLDNQVKAILDAAQGIVFKNDCWIDMLEASRGLGDNDHTWVTVRAIPARCIKTVVSARI